MKAIGGYFELADYEEKSEFPLQEGILLNTGRNALEYVLRSIGEVKRIYLPYYTCEVVLEPIEKLHVPYTFYHINQQFEIVDDVIPEKGEYIIINNYFGIKDAYIKIMSERYGDQLIVDCAQALFAKPVPKTKSFYSVRKYVGVADGGVAYLDKQPDNNVEVVEVDNSNDHNSHLLKRRQYGAEAGFTDFQANEKKLGNQPIRWMSDDTKRILAYVNYDKIVFKRRRNFQYLHNSLGDENNLSLPEMDSFSCPMVYPLMVSNGKLLREKLIENKVFVARYWPNVENKEGFETECGMAENIVPIPCDQRYGIDEMDKVIDIIKQKDNL